MQNAVQQVAVLASNPLAVICFGVGIVALLFVFRHTIFRRRYGDNPLAEMEERFSTAHKQVESITEREQHSKLQAGHRFYRMQQELTKVDRQVLARLSNRQAQGGRRHG